jgi:hypothetical protein
MDLFLAEQELVLTQEQKEILDWMFQGKVSYEMYVTDLNGQAGLHNSLTDKIAIDYEHVNEISVIAHELIHRLQNKHGYISEDEAYHFMYISKLKDFPDEFIQEYTNTKSIEYKNEWFTYLGGK